MTGKDISKIGLAVVILAAAVVLYIWRSKANSAVADDSPTYWYCTKTQKAFTLTGNQNETDVRTARQKAEENTDDGPTARRTGDFITIAKSPYTREWTGVPAAKCPNCGEIFAIDTGKKAIACPKCHWTPSKAPQEVAETASEGKGG
jgi:hypothetical protein